jgi:hypothetical protein
MEDYLRLAAQAAALSDDELLSARLAIANDHPTPAEEALLDELFIRHLDKLVESKFRNIGNCPIPDRSPRST